MASAMLERDVLRMSGQSTSRLKPLIAASVGILVDEGKTSWESFMRKTLPEYRHCNKMISDEATILNSVSHHTGLHGRMSVYSLLEKARVSRLTMLPGSMTFHSRKTRCSGAAED